MALKDALLAEFDHEIAATRKLLERLPDEKLDWKPHERSMSMGDLATHVASIPEWAVTILNTQSFDVSTGPPRAEPRRSRSEILEHFDTVSRKTRAAIDRHDAEYAAAWTLKRGDQDMFSMPRLVTLRTFVFSHLIHHRGQLSVYLRLNDIPVPSIYGPSADEG